MNTSDGHTAFIRDDVSDDVKTVSIDDADAADGYIPQQPVDDDSMPVLADEMQSAIDALASARDDYAREKTTDDLERMLEAVTDVISRWPTLAGFLASRP